MKDNNYPGINNYSEHKDYKPPIYSSRDFEKLVSLPALLNYDNDNFTTLLDDLQGNILLHHSKKFSRYYLIQIGIQNGALEWIQKLNLTAASEQYKDRLNPLINIYFYLTWSGYKKLGLDHLAPFDDKGAFEAGMHTRLPFLELGNKLNDKDIDAMLLIASNQKQSITSKKGYIDAISDWGNVLKIEDGHILRKEMNLKFKRKIKKEKVAVDWFGYRDGISQPIFFPEMAGKVINKDSLSTPRVGLIKDRGGVGKYSAGSYLAFLKIRQDTTAFKEIINEIKSRISVKEINQVISEKTVGRFINNTQQIIDLIILNNDSLIKLKSYLAQYNDIATVDTSLIDIKNEIADLISQSKISDLFYFDEDQEQSLLSAIKTFNPNEPDKAANICNSSKNIRRDTEASFFHSNILEQLIDKILNNVNSINVDKKYLRTLVNDLYSIDSDKKNNLINELKFNGLSFITSQEITTIITKNESLAEAYFIGRFPDGTPVALFDQAQGNRIPENDFTYRYNSVKDRGGDLAGTCCPFSAHIRKVSPREEGQSRLLIRRGVLYGKENGEEKGMLFMCFQRNLVEQFEYIFRHWLNNVQHGSQATGVDTLGGTSINRKYSRWYFPVKWGDNDPNNKVLIPADALRPCISYEYGAYFFAPSISFLNRVLTLSRYNERMKNPNGQNKVAQKPTYVSDTFKVDAVKLSRKIKGIHKE
ncbi:MAG: Dyp-type peroxidase [Saprospiraceae bacterium]|nr:Dyp-type peroxidase [Saprospiraceae bacterium]